MFRKIIFAFIVLLQSNVIAVEKVKFDGICRVTSNNGKQWSGVAVSDSQVVSVWHPEEFGEVYVEFSEIHHGNKTRIRLAANVTKVNRYADLSIITFKVPSYVELRHYKLGRRKSDQIRIAGFVLDSPVVIDRAVTVKNQITDSDGYIFDRYDVPGKSGMSGSPGLEDDIVVGVQSAGAKQVLMVPGETVMRFLNGEIRDER